MKNKTGGSKHKKLKRVREARAIRYPVEGEGYAKVEKMTGSLMAIIQLATYDPKDPKQGKRLGVICGSIKKKQKIFVSDIIIVSYRSFEEDKVFCTDENSRLRKIDIVHKYENDEIHSIKHIPEINQLVNDNKYEDGDFSFEKNTEEVQGDLIQEQDRIYDFSSDDEVEIDEI